MTEKRAKITKEGGYRCAPEGHTTITIPEGEVVTGKVAEWAIKDKAGQAMGPAKKSKGGAPENKSQKADETK